MVTNRFKELTVEVDASSEAIKNKVKVKIAQSARKLVAVDTGETQDSITVTKDGVEAGSAALFLEFGTVKMAAQPFLGPAAAENRDGFNIYFTEMFVGMEARYAPTPPY